ncbi:hypothetical protein [Desulfovulcanus sp.]
MAQTQQNNAPSLINETTPNQHKTTQLDCFAIINEVFQPLELLCSNVIYGHQHYLDSNITGFASLCSSILNNSKQLMINFLKLITDEIGEILIEQNDDGSRKVIIKKEDNVQHEYINKIHPIIRKHFENALQSLYEALRTYDNILESYVTDDCDDIKRFGHANACCQQALYNLEQVYLNLFKKKDSIPEW